MTIDLTEVECAIGDTLRVGDEVELTFFHAAGRAIRIGVTAPRSLPIVRKEIAVVTGESDASAAREHIRK